MLSEKLVYVKLPLCSRKIINKFENQCEIRIYEDKMFCFAKNKAIQGCKTIHFLDSALLLTQTDINPPRFQWGFHTTGN